MKQQYILSVIVPIYNAENTLIRCLDYLLNQSLKDIEIILIDDKSGDNSYNIIKKYQLQYPSKIKIIQNLINLGVGQTRNKGIDNASGRYISFVDSDDWIDSNLYEKVVNSISRENADIAIFGVKDEYSSYHYSKIRYNYKSNSFTNDFALRLLSRSEANDVYVSPMVTQKIYDKNFINKYNLRFREDSYFEDDEFTFKCFLNECKIITVPDVYYHYYQRQGSIMHSFTHKHIKDFINCFNYIKSAILEKNLWELHSDKYYKYFHKCLRVLLLTMLNNEQNINAQKAYIKYFFQNLNDLSISDLIEYFDIESIRHILL